MSLLRRGSIAPLGAFVRGCVLLIGCAPLGGCVDVAGDPPNPEARPQFVRRDDANMSGPTLAIASVDGAPAEVAARFSQSLDQSVGDRHIAVAAPAKARYLARGYLTASPVEGGAQVDFVWDIFTPDKQRVQRLSDAIAVKGSGDDPWAIVGEAGLDSVAAKSADDLAAYLSNTPEAAPEGAALSYAQ